MIDTSRVWRSAGTAGLGLWLAACAPVATFTKRDNPCPARDRCCQVSLLDGRSPRPYQVIGVIDVEAFAVSSIPREEDAFLKLVRERVCAAGGDGVIPGINGDGRYIQATVVKWTTPGESGPVCAPPPDHETTPQPAATEGAEAQDGAPANAPESAAASPESATALRGGAPC